MVFINEYFLEMEESFDTTFTRIVYPPPPLPFPRQSLHNTIKKGCKIEKGAQKKLEWLEEK